MTTFLHIKNPLSKEVNHVLKLGRVKTVLDAAKKIWSKELGNFEIPTVCLVGDKPLMRDEWATYKPKKDDVVSFVAVVGGPEIWIPLLISVVLSVAVSLLFAVPVPTVGAIPEPDPVYTLRGQTNKIRLGDPIEEHYGRVRIWPSYAAISYNKYIDNDQYLYSLFCVGNGEFDIGQVYIQDTAIENFEDLEIVTYAPGVTVDLFRDNVETSAEVSDLILFGPNEDDYDSYVGPITANTSGTSADILEWDITIPGGLNFSNDEGGLDSRTVSATFEYRAIDSLGDPTGDASWSAVTFSKTLKTTTTQRFTITQSVAAGRYEVRARRTNNKDKNYRANNEIRWEVLRAFLPNVGTYGDVTMLAMRAKASNSLNDSARSQLNLFATRKLPIYDGSSWSAPTATRSAVWAMANVFRTSNGGDLEDARLDLADFITKDATLTSEGRNFDWTFDGRGGAWGDAGLVARAVRGRPLLQGSKIILALERAKTIPTAVYGPNNIVEGSFEWDIKIYNENEYDGIEIEYTNYLTWRPEVIECFLSDSSGDNLDTMKIPGVTDPVFAYREGMYEEAKRRYHRENLKISTGLEGHIPTWGDLIQVNHDVPRWGQGGLVLSVVGTVITLDTDVVFEAGETHKILLKTKAGETSGPHTVTAVGGNSKQVDTGTAIDSTDFQFGNTYEKPIFLFGVENLEGKFLTVVDIQSNGEEEVEITGVNYDVRVFAEDLNSSSGTTPTPSVIGAGDGLNVITGLSLAVNTNATEVTVSWNAARAARSFVVQWSDNVTDYTDTEQIAGHSLTIPIAYVPVYIRVAAVTDLGQGPWASTSLTAASLVGATPIVPASVTVVSGYGQLLVSWDEQAGADSFEISLSTTSGTTPVVDATTPIASYLLTGLGDTEIHYFQIRAKKTLTDGTLLVSAWSAEVTGTTSAVIGSNYYTPTEPGDPGKVGAAWFDTSDDDRIYIWDGSAWVDAQYILSVTELTSVIGANEIIANTANIADAIITSAKIADLVASKITSGTIDAAVITLNGTGGEIKSNDFVSGTSGFQILGNGNAEFNDIVVNNATVSGLLDTVTMRASKILVDDDVWLYRSDAQTKPARPVVSQAVQKSLSSGTNAPIYTPEVTFRGYDAAGATTENRVLSTSSQTYTISIDFYADENAAFSTLTEDLLLQTSTDGSSWSTLDIVKTTQEALGGNESSVFAQYSGVRVFTLTSTSVRYFRARFNEYIYNLECSLHITTQNWL